MILSYTTTNYLFYKPLTYGCFSLAVISIILELLWRITDSAIFSLELWNMICFFGMVLMLVILGVLFLTIYKKNQAINENDVRKAKDDIKENIILITMVILVIMSISLFAMVMTRIIVFQFINFALIFIN